MPSNLVLNVALNKNTTHQHTHKIQQKPKTKPKSPVKNAELKQTDYIYFLSPNLTSWCIFLKILQPTSERYYHP